MTSPSNYRVLHATETINDLEEQVNALLAAGWQLAGGVCVTTERVQTYTFWHYYQAMVKPATPAGKAAGVEEV